MNAVELSQQGNQLRAEGRLEEALACQRRALQGAPENWGIRVNYAVALQDLGYLDEAIICFTEASQQSHQPLTEVNLAMAKLRAGQLQAGFQGFLYRWQVPQWPQKPYQLPFPHLLNAEQVFNAAVVLVPDQGYGDTLMALPWIRGLAERNPEVSVIVRPPLLELVQVALGDVCSSICCSTQTPYAGWLSGFDVPAVSAEVLADYARQRQKIEVRLREYLAEPIQPVEAVGLVWQGNQGHSLDRWRSISTSTLVENLRQADSSIIWWGLSPDVSDDDIRLFAEAGIGLHRPKPGSFMDTARSLMACRSLLTVDTAAVHLAGLLGVPTRLLVNLLGDWRWGHQESRSLWYPHIQIFRQTRLSDWDTPIRSVLVNLRAKLSSQK